MNTRTLSKCSIPGFAGVFSTVYCTRCRSTMAPTHREEHPRSVLERYQCTVCGLREVVTTPVPPTDPPHRYCARDRQRTLPTPPVV
jgi:hypothetical protein